VEIRPRKIMEAKTQLFIVVVGGHDFSSETSWKKLINEMGQKCIYIIIIYFNAREGSTST
jgi:hypothetical protein